MKPALILALLLLFSFSFEYQSDDTSILINTSLIGIVLVFFFIYKLLKEIRAYAEYKISIQEMFQYKVVSEYEKIIPSIFIIFLLGNFSASHEASLEVDIIFWRLSWGRDYLSLMVLLPSFFAIFLHRVLQLIKLGRQGIITTSL